MLFAMDPDDKDDDTDSTIVRRGKEAFLFAEMGRFAKELQERPLPKLLEDLPGLLELPESKYAIVAMTLKRRMRASDVDREAIVSQVGLLLPHVSAAQRARGEALLGSL
jgi:hypothetical protein